MSRYEDFSSETGPNIQILKSTIRHFGEPKIDYEGLRVLFDEDLELDASAVTLKFYSGYQLGDIPKPGDVWRYGYRTPYTNTLHIPVSTLNGATSTPMSKVIAHGLALRDKLAQPPVIRYAASEVTVGSSAAIGVGLAENIGGLTLAGAIGLMGTLMAKNESSRTGSGEGRSLVVYDLREEHDSDVVFPAQATLRYHDQLED